MATVDPIEDSPPDQTQSRWFLRRGLWFWSLMVIGAAVRIYLVVFTQGTYDAGLWQLNAMGVNGLGLLDYYHANPNANHPPFALQCGACIWRIAQTTGIPFQVLFRAPIASLDAATALLLMRLLRFHRWRFVSTAAYWINPLAILLSAYQGNTDSVIAFFLLLSVWLLSEQQTAVAAIAAGISLWIKLPGVLAIPALALYLRDWRRRFLFLVLSGLVALVGYLPVLIQDPGVIAANVLGYHGRMLQTQAGVPAWGPRVLLFSVIAEPDKWPEQLHAPILFFLQHNWQIGTLFALIVIGLRISRRSLPALCATIAMAYATLCGMTDYWAFQYFAWSLPFWFFLRPWFLVSATLLVSTYLYSLYWVLCGNPWLLGTWNFAGHLDWPAPVIIFRNLAVVFFFGCACAFLAGAVVGQVAQLKREPRRDLAA